MPSTNYKGFAIVDCNNFFVSCERVFQPEFEKVPVAVLSSNDGCFIARSQEVKDLGIPMGAPAFKYQDLIKRHHIKTFSSNFKLYNDMSSRVMQTITHFYPQLEIYSVDEAFIPLKDLNEEPLKGLIKTIKQWTGIVVSIGLAKTKTLSKVANSIAKKKKCGLFSLLDPKEIDKQLSQVPINDVWGVGRRNTKKFLKERVYSALDYKNASKHWVKKVLHMPGLRTQLELNEIPCNYPEIENEDPKSLTFSRSFGKPIHDIIELREAIASYVYRACEKLRSKKMHTQSVGLYLQTYEESFYHSFYISVATDSPIEVLKSTNVLLKFLFKPLIYKKAGIVFSTLTKKDHPQLSFIERDSKRDALFEMVDQINSRYGANTLFLASQGLEKNWSVKREKLSKEYTTNWNQVLKVRI